MTRMKHIGLVLVSALLGASGAHAQEHATSTVAEGAAKTAMKHAAPACSDARPECAMTVFPAFDKKGPTVGRVLGRQDGLRRVLRRWRQKLCGACRRRQRC
jgi:hypothetical protein